MTYQEAKYRLHKMTKENSKARGLGERFLLRRTLTTADIVSVNGWMCSSILERLRLDLRGRCGWDIRVEPIDGKASCRYTLVLEDA